jgi:hypothetical protein
VWPPAGSRAARTWRCRCDRTRSSFLGDRIDYEVEITKSDLVLRVAALPSPPLQPGDTVHLRIDPAACVPLAAD